MWKLNDVTQIEYRSGYSFFIAFDDGLGATIDFSDYLRRGPIFAPLRDPDFFRQARIEGGTIAWPNGADVVPETLYEKCEQAAVADTPAKPKVSLVVDTRDAVVALPLLTPSCAVLD
jgi:hypothetical protein